MFRADQYELLDFGKGRKLERFGGFLLDRPSPAVCGSHRSRPGIWSQAASRYQRTRGDCGVWLPEGALPASWTITHGSLRLEVRPSSFGHVGVFPEQAANWDWLADKVSGVGHPIRVLNLFASTGGATLAAAAGGAEVVHVDAARNVVRWAKRNAELSGMQAAPIRWIVEDASDFVRRELRRNQTYHAVILDPPSYGHGPRKQVWKIAEHLPTLLASCAQLTASDCAFVLLTCHSPGCGPDELDAMMRKAGFGSRRQPSQVASLDLLATDGRRLPSGVVVRWPG